MTDVPRRRPPTSGERLAIITSGLGVGSDQGFTRMALGIAQTPAASPNPALLGGGGSSGGTFVPQGTLGTGLGGAVSAGTGSTVHGFGAFGAAGGTVNTGADSGIAIIGAVSGIGGIAIGSNTVVNNDGGVAIGTDSTGAGAHASATDAISLGTVKHTTTIAGRLVTGFSGTAGAKFNIPHGTAPTSPVNGDMWTTTAGLYVQINGATVGPLT